MTTNIIEFKAQEEKPDITGNPRLTHTRPDHGSAKNVFCQHTSGLTINVDTELVECKCGVRLSAFNALLIISKKWERMRGEVESWKQMKAEQDRDRKSDAVKKIIKELQWVELPEVGDEPARSIWIRITEATGKEPYALYRERLKRYGGNKEPKYRVINPPAGYCGYEDAESVIASARRDGLKVVS